MSTTTINKLQLLQQNMQQILLQKQQLGDQVTEIDSALHELKKTDKLQLIMPRGAYYAFPKINRKINDNALVLELIQKAKVAVVPGSAFGQGGENHIRISFGAEEHILREGLQRLVKYLQNY